MKFLKFLSIFLAAAFIFTACEKEYSYEDGTAKGSLKKDDATQDCLPIAVNGAYVKDTVLKAATNFVDIQANITETGAYDIRTDTVNGYYFRGVGSTGTTGLNNIRLIGYGKPIASSVDEFTVAFDTSHCTFSVQVTATPVTTGAFILGTATDHCTGIAVQGTYTVSTAMTAANKITVPITITNTGGFTLTATPATTSNNVTFSVTGTFLSNGTATVDLAASGTPAAAGPFTYNISDGTNTCSFTVNYVGAGPAATIAAIDCSTATFTGVYQAGASAAGNTATISVTPATTGSYTITTTAVNGVTFSGSGTFTTTAAQPVILTASGTAGATMGSVGYPITGTPTCTFNVTYTAGAGPAAFAITCGSIVVNGDYVKGLPLDGTNTITVPVNVTTPGAYTMTATAPTSGVTFSGSGTFAAGGPQTITLTSTQTSTAGGSVTYTTSSTSATATCTFVVDYDFVEYSLNGAPLELDRYFLEASYDNTTIAGYNLLNIAGYVSSDVTDDNGFGLAIGLPGAATPTASTSYTINEFPGKIVAGQYTDASQAGFLAITDPSTNTQTPTFTITVTSISGTRVSGTFSGALRDDTGTGAVTKTVTNGAFSVKIQ
jgi:hypothetical protein